MNRIRFLIVLLLGSHLYGMDESANRAIHSGVGQARVDQANAGPANAEPADRCSICLDDLVADVATLPCGHRLHAMCLARLVQGSNKCPVCRGIIDVHLPAVQAVVQPHPDEVPNICAHCLDALDAHDAQHPVRVLACGHTLHAACADQREQAHNDCPICGAGVNPALPVVGIDQDQDVAAFMEYMARLVARYNRFLRLRTWWICFDVAANLLYARYPPKNRATRECFGAFNVSQGIFRTMATLVKPSLYGLPYHWVDILYCGVPMVIGALQSRQATRQPAAPVSWRMHAALLAVQAVACGLSAADYAILNMN